MAFDIFLKFDSSALAGESVNEKHKSEIDVHSFSWGESRDGATTDPQELAVVTPLSIASPQLAKFCAERTTIPSATISVNAISAKGVGDLLMIKLKDVTVGSYQLGVADTDAGLSDRFTLAFQSMHIAKRRQADNGSIGTVSEADIDFSPPAA